jgi:WD40 repeat protein
LQFAPDGGRLAVFITDMDEEVAGRIKGHLVQVVEFPGGKRLCEFPAGEDYALRLAFTRDGRRIVAGDRLMNVMIRDASTGEVVRRFEPAMRSQLMGVAISAQEKHVAAYERANQKDGKPDTGDLLIWDNASGKLLHRLTASQLHERNGAGPVYGAMRFSPDGRHLAAESGGRVFVIDVASGEIVTALRSNFVQWLQWSADGTTLIGISPIAGSEGGGDHPPGRYDVFPRVRIWDWRSGELRASVPR